LDIDQEESYHFSKLGYETAAFVEGVKQQIWNLREESLQEIKEIAPALSAIQASRLAKLMPLGAAAPLGLCEQIAPSFVEALEKKLANTRASESYEVFKDLGERGQIWVGFRKNKVIGGADDAGEAKAATVIEVDAADSEESAQDPFLIWLIAPSPCGQFAAVEFAEADSATFVYRTGGDFEIFAKRLNRALEAINFKREVIRLSDEELRAPENADYYMASKRTAALQFVRENFVGRVIHSGVENWKRKLLELYSENNMLLEVRHEKI